MCPICGSENCEFHKRARIVSLSSGLADRLERGPSRGPAWALYNVGLGGIGMLPLTLAVNPPSAKPGYESFWLKEIRRGGDKLRQVFVDLVRVEAYAGESLRLFESSSPFVGGPGVLARGRAQSGFFALSLNIFPPDTSASDVVGEWVANVSALAGLGWGSGHFPGVIRQGMIQNATHERRRGEALAVYDHRPTWSSVARVTITRKTAGDRVWEHLDLYPADERPVATIHLGNWRFALPDDQVVGYIFQSTSTGSHAQQATTVLVIGVGLETAGGLDVERIKLDVLDAVADGDPAWSCNAYEALLLALVATGAVTVDEEQESRWGRYQACRARAERSDFENESEIAWRKAIDILARLTNFPEES